VILRSWAFVVSWPVGPRAIPVQSAQRTNTSTASSHVIQPGAPVIVDEAAQPLRDPLVSLSRGVLVDQSGAHVVMPHPRHEVLRGGACARGKVVAGVPQVVLKPTSA
jgi:hypothetical protein